eukprot:2290858-Prymnesium_polylepis.1
MCAASVAARVRSAWPGAAARAMSAVLAVFTALAMCWPHCVYVCVTRFGGGSGPSRGTPL